jgi:hypothetical protein
MEVNCPAEQKERLQMKYNRVLISFSYAMALGLSLTLIAPDTRAETVSLTCTVVRLEGKPEAADTSTLKIDFDAKVATWNGQTGPVLLNEKRPDIVLFLGWVNSRTATFYRDTGVFGYSVRAADGSHYARSSNCRKS